MKTAIVTGSFDPITNGHYDLILRAAALFPKVIVAVLDNTEKHLLFRSQKRYLSVKRCFDAVPNVEVLLWDGLLADLAEQTADAVIVRGARNAVDFDYEKMLFEINRTLSGVESVILPAKKEYEFISSTFVKELIKYKKPIDGFVPERAIEVLISDD